MVRKLSLVKATDQFTFIRTMKVTTPRNDSSEFGTNNLSSENSASLLEPDQLSQEDFSDQQLSSEQLDDSQIKNSSALLTIDQQKMSSHLSLNNHPISISDHWYQQDFQTTNSSLFIPEILIPPLEIEDPAPQPKSNYYLDRLLVVAAIGYCGFLGWSLFGAQNSIFPTALLRTNQPTISQADLDFLTYFEKSLAVIDNKPDSKNSSENHQATNKDKDKGLVYLPVYTPTPPVQKNTNNFSLQPNSLLPPPPPPNNFAALNPPAASSPIKQPAPPSQLSADTNKKAPSNDNLSIASSKVSVLNPGNQAKVQNTAPQLHIQPTLVGIIELKDNSAALFKVNGTTEKIWLGDKIGNTSWTLVAINNQKAKISYQGNNLTLGIGQSFDVAP